MDNFIYYAPTKVYFGKEQENNIGKLIKEYHPHKVLIHYGMGSVIKSGLLLKVERLLENEDIQYICLGGVKPNPDLDLVREGIALAKKEGVDFILAIGGGSVLDSGKDIANGLANPEDDVWDYHLGNKKPQKTTHKACILTISAAGSEMSDSSVISNYKTQVKKGYGSPFNRFDIAIENPELTYSVSPYQTACGVVDIGMHTIERYFALGSGSELTDSIAEGIIKNIFICGKQCIDNPIDYEARANMMWASSLSHNGLTGCGRSFLLTVHQLEHVLSAVYPDVAHGAGLAALWCSWARYVHKDAHERFIKYARNVWLIEEKDEEKAVLEAIDRQEKYYQDIGMPTSLEELDVKYEDLENMALKCSLNKSRIIPGYKPLGYQEILDIYRLAYHKK